MYGSIPIIASEDSLGLYLKEIKKFPLLTLEEEKSLSKSLNADGDTDAAHRLVTSHLRLVAKISMGYKGYGLPLSDIIAEGNIGLMQAVKDLILIEGSGLQHMLYGGSKRQFKNMCCVHGVLLKWVQPRTKRNYSSI